jgi:hypothetical protein
VNTIDRGAFVVKMRGKGRGQGKYWGQDGM